MKIFALIWEAPIFFIRWRVNTMMRYFPSTFSYLKTVFNFYSYPLKLNEKPTHINKYQTRLLLSCNFVFRQKHFGAWGSHRKQGKSKSRQQLFPIAPLSPCASWCKAKLDSDPASVTWEGLEPPKWMKPYPIQLFWLAVFKMLPLTLVFWSCLLYLHVSAFLSMQ